MIRWLKNLMSPTPKAVHITPPGDHIENLAAHPIVAIDPIGDANGTPLWLDTPPQDRTDQTYDDLFWEIEPMGEYLYYLAGDFPKNEKGLLRFASATVHAEVHVCFEDDVLSVAAIDPPIYAKRGANAAMDNTDFRGMTVGAITTFAKEKGLEQGSDRSIAQLRFPTTCGGLGWVQLSSAFAQNTPDVRLEWVKQDTTSQGPRLTQITVSCSNPDQDFIILDDMMQMLIARYHSIADHKLSGATRM